MKGPNKVLINKFRGGPFSGGGGGGEGGGGGGRGRGEGV